jgi:hypothetical protein
LQHAATFDDGEVVGSRDEIGRVMGDVEEGEVEFPLEIAKESAQVASQGGIEMGEGFVEEDEARLKDQGATDGGACRFAAGECGGEVMETRAEIEAVRHDLGAGATLVAVDALEAEGKFELFDQGQVGKEPGRLGDPAAGAFLGRKSGDVGVVEENPSGIREFEAGDEAEGGGLATAGGAHEEVVGTGGDVDGEVLHRMNGPEVFADSLESDARHDGERFKVSDSSLKLEGAASPRPSRLLGVNDRPAHQPGAEEVLLRGVASPSRMDSRMPGMERRKRVSWMLRQSSSETRTALERFPVM